MATRVIVSGVVERDGKFLVLKRSGTAHFAPNQWEFINGSLQESETVEKTLKRELVEETGLELVSQSKFPVYEISDEDGDWVVLPFRVETKGDITLSQEHSEYKWASPDELTQLEGVSEDWQKIGKYFNE
ncbi:MAG TPA: NUDIX domain-containing protein [Candidatus Saccharimonadales bacterium]|jgi:8-oxo-dGTP diphosphatase